MPFLLIHGDPTVAARPPGHPAGTPGGVVRHADPGSPRRPPPRWKLASSVQSFPATDTTLGTTTTVPAEATTTVPQPAPPVSGQDVAHRVAVPTTPPPPPTTTTTPPVAAAPSGALTYGQVTYYDHPAGTCASPWLPFGTVVEVTNPANGSSVSCVVNDREADTARAIDLATTTFAALAPLSQGVVDAQLRW